MMITRSTGRAAAASAAVAVLVAALSATALPARSATTPAKPYDFDGNGYVDLAVGAPTMRVGKVKRAGGVVVLPASKKGPSHTEKIITQSSAGVPGASESDDEFGYAVASADFNRDGYADLAVGQPGEQVGAAQEAGSVTVVYGSKKGLNTAKSVAITQPGGAVAGQAWGTSLTALDLNVDGYPDLAVGAPLRDNFGYGPSGLVGVLAGGAKGIAAKPLAMISGELGTDPEDPTAEGDYFFGDALTTGDLDGDHRADLVILSSGSSAEGESEPGSLTVCLAKWAKPGGCMRLHHDSYGSVLLEGAASIAVGNMSGDATPEIVVGNAEYTEGGGPGWVSVFHLTRAGGLKITSTTDILQSSNGVPGSNEDEDGFGQALTLGDINRDGYADLVVGSPGENADRGQVTVILGARSGWKTSGNYSFSQNTKGIPGSAEKGDLFGTSVTLADHNRDGRLDLTVGAPGEDHDAGAISTIPGSGTKFSASRSHTFGLKSVRYAYPSGAGFGASLGR